MTPRAAAAALLAAACALPGALAHEPHPLSAISYARMTRHADAAVTLKAAPALLQRSGELVNVTFAGFSSAGFLAAYSPPPGADLGATAPVEWFALPAGGGAGTYTFRLINMRAEYQFVLFTGSVDKPVAVAASNTVTFASLSEPRAPRLALLAADATAMQLTWTAGAAGVAPAVNVTSATTGATTTFAATADAWTAADLCGAPATTVGYRDPGGTYTAVMRGLVPGETYTYVFGDAAGSSDAHSFTQPSGAYPYGLAFYGDEGQRSSDGTAIVMDFPPAPNTSALVAAWLDAAGPGVVQGVHHIGDISYARGYQADWEIFLDMNAKISSRVSYAVDQGNHEADFPSGPQGQGAPVTWLTGTDSGGECGVPTRKLFPMPWPSFAQPWFSISNGPVTVIHMTTEWDFSTSSSQWTWLKGALASVNRSATPWLIFVGHRPMYISSTNEEAPGGDQPVAEALRTHVEPLLLAAKVDLAMWGHHHSYQAHCASSGGACAARSTRVGDARVFVNPPAPVQMVIGTAGAGFSTNIQIPPPAFNEFVLFNHGYARVMLHNASALEWQFVDDVAGEVLDHMWILKAAKA